MPNPWDNDPIVGSSGSSINATPLPRNPQVVQKEAREEARENRKEGFDRDDRNFDNTKKFRDEFTGLPSVKEFNVALGTYSSALKTKPTAEGDQALIVSFARMLDPNSVVREGEFVIAAGNESNVNQIKARLAKEFGVDGAGRLTDQGRQRLREEMRNLVVERFQAPYERDRRQYSQFARMEGIDPYLVVGEPALAAFPAGVLDPIKADSSDSSMAGAGATERGKKLPQEYQDAHYAYLRQNWGRIDAQDYAAFRSNLDERFGFNPNTDAYAAAVPGFNEAAALGVTPGQLGAVPNPPQAMNGFQQGLNSFASSETGALLANAANAGTMGLPARLSGNQDKIEVMRDAYPGASTGGEILGGISGGLMTGGGLAAGAQAGAGRFGAGVMGNPLTADLLYSGIYGATQDDNALRGLGTGAVSGLTGNISGRAIGSAFPRLFNPRGVAQADNSVPTNAELREQAAAQYAAAEAAGEAAGPDQTQGLYDAAQTLLAREGRVTPMGRLIDTDTPVTRANTLMQDFAGQTMTPTQAGSVRKVLGEGLTATRDGAPDRESRRLSGLMLDQFDEWAQPVLPGIDEARETASRYLQGEQIAQARELADANSQWFTQSGPENALRRSFRDLDRSVIRGTRSFDDQVEGAINNVSRGNRFSNAMRSVGKFAPTGVIPIMGAASLGTAAGAGTGSLTGGLVTGAVMGGGLLGRAIATQQTRRAAEVAELMARGGPEYAELLNGAITLASRRGGNVMSGLFGAPLSQRYRETTR